MARGEPPGPQKRGWGGGGIRLLSVGPVLPWPQWPRARQRVGGRHPRSAHRPSGEPARTSTSRRAATTEPTLRVRAREAARRELGGHALDAAAVGLLVVAALLTLGLIGDLAGLLGTGLADSVGTLLGRARYAVPVVLVVLAILLFSVRPAARRAAEAEEAGEQAPTEPTPLRVAVGFALVFVAAVGFLHLAFDSPCDRRLPRASARCRWSAGRRDRRAPRGRGRARSARRSCSPGSRCSVRSSRRECRCTRSSPAWAGRRAGPAARRASTPARSAT